jgi:serine protease Do
MLRMQRQARHSCWIRDVFIILLVASACLLSCLTVYADSMPGGNLADPAVRAVDVAEPAVVRIITTIKGHLTVHFPPTTQVTFPQQDNGSYSLQISGTGTFITSQGDILTTDHVVNPPKDKTLDQMLYNAAAQDVANYINQNAKQNSSQVTNDAVTQQLSSGQLSSTASYDSPVSSVVYLSTSYTGPLTASDLSSLPTGVSWQVDQIKKESPGQQDLAIVHVPIRDGPSVQLVDSSKIGNQGSFTVIGFPGNVNTSQQANDFLTLSVNAGAGSSQQTQAMATPAVDPNGDNGSGGGLIVDSQGNIVGLISSTSNISGSSLSQANNNEHAMLNSLNLDTTPGQFQQLWSQAFQDYTSTDPSSASASPVQIGCMGTGCASHWQKALDDFNQLATNYPNFKAAQPYLNYVQQQVQSEQVTPTVAPSPTVSPSPQVHRSSNLKPKLGPIAFPSVQVLTITAIILLLGLVVLLFAVIGGRAKKAKLAKTREREQDANNPATSQGVVRRGSGEKSADSVLSASPQPNVSEGSSSQSTLVLKIWPCGHMNRPGARFCSICGEVAPSDNP